MWKLGRSGKRQQETRLAVGQVALGLASTLLRKTKLRLSVVLAVLPSPATHAILAHLKAGETVYQAGELPETLRVSKIDYEPPKTACKTIFASIFSPSMENGDGTRQHAHARGAQAPPHARDHRAEHVVPPAVPTPATHAILAQLKAEETAYQASELPKKTL